MKILGGIFLIAGVVLAILGYSNKDPVGDDICFKNGGWHLGLASYFHTPDKPLFKRSFDDLMELAYRGEVINQRDRITFATALKTRDINYTYGTIDGELMQRAWKIFKEGTFPSDYALESEISDATAKLGEAERSYFILKDARDEKQKWEYLIGGTLAVLGLVLCVIPAPRNGAKSVQAERSQTEGVSP